MNVGTGRYYGGGPGSWSVVDANTRLPFACALEMTSDEADQYHRMATGGDMLQIRTSRPGGIIFAKTNALF